MTLAIVKENDGGVIDHEEDNECTNFKLMHLDLIPDILSMPPENAISMVKELVASLIPNSVELNGRRLAVLTVTPNLAKLLLRASQGNRSAQMTTVQKYSRPMKAGDWVESTNIMMIMDNFKLGDAHHRLWAQVESGVTLSYTIHLNATKRELASIDCGRVRTQANQVQILSKDHIPATMTTILKYALIYDGGGDLTCFKTPALRARHAMISPYEIEAMYEKNKPLAIQAAAYTTAVSRRFQSPIVAGYMYYILARQFKEKAMLFFEKLSTGIGLSGTEVIYILQERLISMKNNRAMVRYANTEVEFYICKAWDIHINNRPVPRLLVHSSNETLKRPY